MDFSYDVLDAYCLRFCESVGRETDAYDIMSWNKKHPEMWSSCDIINWIYSVAVSLDLNLDKLRGERFQDLSGQQFCRLSFDDFIERDHLNGGRLYNCLRELLKQSQFVPPSDLTDLDDCLDDCFDDIESLCRYAEFQKLDLDKWDAAVNSYEPIPSFSIFLDPVNKLPFDDLSPFSESNDIPGLPSCLSPYHRVDNDPRNTTVQDSGYESAESTSENFSRSPVSQPPPPLSSIRTLIPPTTSKHLFVNTLSGTDHRSVGQSMSISTADDRVTLKPVVAVAGSDRPPKRKPGRPPKRTLSASSSSSSSSSTDENSIPVPAKKSKKKNTHLWKFMRSLLEDPMYNPSSIKWENKKDGVFRIVPGQSKVIAKLWGQRKNNPSMTFDKMSRSLRWCRTYGFLSEVPKNANYPKKLCFRFGERAADWQM